MPQWLRRGSLRRAVAAAVLLAWGAPALAAPADAACDKTDAKPARCARIARKNAAGTNAAPKTIARKNAGNGHPALEIGGTMPATGGTVPLLRPGTFRLDMSAYYASYPLFGWGNMRTSSANASLLGTFTLGYGVNDRLTIFGGASESNIVQSNGSLTGEFVDPRIGLVYRVAQPAQAWGNSVDFVGDVTANAPLSNPPVNAVGPYGNLGPIARGRVLVTRELGHGFTLQVNGGFQAALITSSPYGNLPTRSTEVDAIFGVAGQYRLSQLSDRLYVNGELDVLKPLTNSEVQIYASPFRTADVYSATLGASYVIKPGFLVARVTDTVALNVVNGNNLFPPTGPRHFVSNTVGLTLSFVNLTPQNWLRDLGR